MLPSPALDTDIGLTGVWGYPEPDFLWEKLQVFPRRSSANPHDDWAVYASGACLAWAEGWLEDGRWLQPEVAWTRRSHHSDPLNVLIQQETAPPAWTGPQRRRPLP